MSKPMTLPIATPQQRAVAEKFVQSLPAASQQVAAKALADAEKAADQGAQPVVYIQEGWLKGVAEPPFHTPFGSPGGSTFQPGPVGPTSPTAPGGTVSKATWNTQSVPFVASTMLLMTNGNVMAQEENSPNWWVLKPDAKGSYANGTWTQTAPMSKGRLYYASAVLNDGRLAVFGGEYTGDAGQTEDNTGEIYDPATNKWTPVSGPPGWSMVGDAPCAMLPDGKILLGSIADNRTALFDPKTATWSDAGTKLAPSAEESWVLLRDGSVLTVDCDPSRTQPAQKAERWTPGKGWEDAGTVPVALCETASEEIGPGLALDDGRAFYVGATGHTAFYTPGKGGKLGAWEAGPDLPKDASGKQFAAKDAPAALLPNGHVLVTASAVDGTSDDYGDSTAFFDIDPTVKPATVTAVPGPNVDGGPAFEGRMMLLPDGKGLYTQGANQVSTFDSGSTEIEARRPSITDAPERVAPGATFELCGRRLNGASGSVGYGDDSSATTSYPIVRLTDKSTGNVYYATTHDHSTMGLTTGKKHQSTEVTLPAEIPTGKYEMQVVASGVASHPWSIHVRTADKD